MFDVWASPTCMLERVPNVFKYSNVLYDGATKSLMRESNDTLGKDFVLFAPAQPQQAHNIFTTLKYVEMRLKRCSTRIQRCHTVPDKLLFNV